MHAPIPVQGIEVSLQTRKPVKAVRSLATGDTLETSDRDGGAVRVRLGTLKHYDIVLYEY